MVDLKDLANQRKNHGGEHLHGKEASIPRQVVDKVLEDLRHRSPRTVLLGVFPII